MNQPISYAIDFGTSNSLLSYVTSEGVQRPLEIDPGTSEPTILRSLMYFGKKGDPVFGQQAIDKYVEEAGEGRFIRSIKKFLPSPHFTGTRINNKHYDLEDLISRFLREMKARADKNWPEPVTKLVLGRPAKFSLEKQEDQLAQDRLQKAAELAGFEEIEFCPEPLAAAYDYRNEIQSEKKILVVDLGGGTSDFTVIKMAPGQSLEVLSMGGVSVAGDILDGAIMSEEISPYFGSEVSYQMPLSSNIMKMPTNLKYRLASPADITLMSRSDIMDFLNQVRKSTINKDDDELMENLFQLISDNQGFAIFEEIEKGKRALGEQESFTYNFSELELYIEHNVTQSRFEDVIRPKVDKIFACLDEVLSESGLDAQQIDSICLTGGTSKVSMVKSELIQRFGEERVQTYKNFHSVIQGLAERAQELWV